MYPKISKCADNKMYQMCRYQMYLINISNIILLQIFAKSNKCIKDEQRTESNKCIKGEQCKCKENFICIKIKNS